jgi:hypothetical protein
MAFGFKDIEVVSVKVEKRENKVEKSDRKDPGWLDVKDETIREIAQDANDASTTLRGKLAQIVDQYEELVVQANFCDAYGSTISNPSDADGALLFKALCDADDKGLTEILWNIGKVNHKVMWNVNLSTMHQVITVAANNGISPALACKGVWLGAQGSCKDMSNHYKSLAEDIRLAWRLIDTTPLGGLMSKGRTKSCESEGEEIAKNITVKKVKQAAVSQNEDMT